MRKELFSVVACISCAIGGSIIGVLFFFIGGYHYELLGIEVKTLLIGGGLMGALIAASVISSLWLFKKKHFMLRIGIATIGGSIAGGGGGWIGYLVVGHLGWISQWDIVGSGLYFGASIALCIISWIELSKRWSRLIKILVSPVVGGLGSLFLAFSLGVGFDPAFLWVVLWFILWGALTSTAIILPLVLISGSPLEGLTQISIAETHKQRSR